jgi:predicted metal-dependent hydrolase
LRISNILFPGLQPKAKIEKFRRAIAVGERVLHYTVVHHPRRRHVELQYDSLEGLVVRVPMRYSRARCEALIRDNIDWITRRSAANPTMPRAADIGNGHYFEWLGIPRVVAVSLRQAGRSRAMLVGDTLWVTNPPTATRPIVERWARSEAARYFRNRVTYWVPRLDVGHPARITVRAQRRRWGSCTAEGRISLNWRLMQLPPTLIDYVVVHELAHLRHLDHSPKFWGLVADAIPDHAHREECLARQGMSLRL